MKKKSWVFKLSIFVLTIISAFAVLRLTFILSEYRIRNEIIESVHDHLDDFSSQSEKMMNGNMGREEFRGFLVNKDIDFPKVVNYYYKGKGFGSATIYYGVYFVPDDNVEGSFRGLLKKKDGDTWLYQENNSDNTMYLEKIGQSFYYYKNTY
ncbi:MAG TPA: hypothetical protein DHM90_07310 [Clostridiaceae bacterium]|nr:hypothetical protein [Clostridiaceae bacterium]